MMLQQSKNLEETHKSLLVLMRYAFSLFLRGEKGKSNIFFLFYFRVLLLLKELVLTSTLNVLPRQEKVYVKYLNTQQELH